MRKYTTETHKEGLRGKLFDFLIQHWRKIGVIFLIFLFWIGALGGKAEALTTEDVFSKVNTLPKEEKTEVIEEYEEKVLKYGYNDSPLNVRAEMDIESKWMSQYPSQSTIEILEDLGEWYRVSNGYVKSEYVLDYIEMYRRGKILNDAPIYAQPKSGSEKFGMVHKDEEEFFIKKENGYLELNSGGYVKEDVVTFDYVSAPEIHASILSLDDMKTWNMINLPIQYLGTLYEKTAGDGVTNKSSLYFRGDIPIYDIIDGFAYFPSGQNIYKLSLDKFSKIQNVGKDYEILAAYRTTYYNSPSGRVHNIGLVADYLDGTVIPSEMTFSYNKTTGPRSKSMGYQLANTIANGETVLDYGGGVCQVSSTIYASILNLDNFKVTARKKHGGDGVSYLPEGMDATVSYGSVDFKFINDNPFSVKLNVKAENNICLVTITRNN